MKITKMISIFAASAVFISCNSTKLNIIENSPVTIFSIQGNPSLYNVDDNLDTEEDADSVLTANLNKYLEANNPEYMTAQDRIDYADDYFRHALEEMAGVQVTDKESLLNCDEYKYSNGSLLGILSADMPASGYQKDFYSVGGKKARLLMKEVGSQALISAIFEFDKHKTLNAVYPVVKMTVRYYDPTGKCTVDTLVVESHESTRYINNKYDKNELVDLYPALIETVVNQYIMMYMM